MNEEQKQSPNKASNNLDASKVYARLSQALLLPSAHIIGQELCNEIQQKIEERRHNKKKKQNENLIKNIESVISKINKNSKNDHQQLIPCEGNLANLELLPDWVDGAQEIDPELEETKPLHIYGRSYFMECQKGMILMEVLLKR